jgi:transposase-like protein
VDETYIRVKGKWVDLYRAVDSSGAMIDFLLSAKRDAAAVERFLAKALTGANHPAPQVNNTDKHADYPAAIAVTQSRRCFGGRTADIDRCSKQRLGTGSPDHQTPVLRKPIFPFVLRPIGAQLAATRRSI